ncbi:hypothetical protein HK100_011441 [Physocladia obscura]|uniref:Uncharacterized protein n=1 Tax=Physocladia obscura TaxID=109957 RepID=A0AAD5T772_9FUNG|nr:hypothetical protein HK100_011441 [Physocladia obscura]
MAPINHINDILPDPARRVKIRCVAQPVVRARIAIALLGNNDDGDGYDKDEYYEDEEWYDENEEGDEEEEDEGFTDEFLDFILYRIDELTQKLSGKAQKGLLIISVGQKTRQHA